MAKRKNGITRREFMQYTAGTVALLSAGGILSSCSSSSSTPPVKEYAQKTYLFNLHHIDLSNHEMTLVAGAKEYPLSTITQEMFNSASVAHPFLGTIGIKHVSHHVHSIDLPKNRHQTCYIRVRNKTTGEVTIPFTFMHHPEQASLSGKLPGATSKPHMRVKWKRYGIDSAQLNGSQFDDNFKDTADHACQLVSAFPQITSLDPASATSINNVIANQDSTLDLATSLTAQKGNWATNRVLVDPTTGQPCKDDQGNPVTTLQWSSGTRKYAGLAIRDSNNALQNDSDYGMNTTNSQPGDTDVTGKMWDYYEGTTYRNPTGGVGASMTASGITYTTTATDLFRYHLEVKSVDANRNITFKIKNNGSRYLIAGVAYKDVNGNLMSFLDIGANFFNSDVFKKSFNYSAAQTGFPLEGMLGPELKFLAIPLKGTDAEFTIPTPSNAQTIVLLGGGPGSSANLFPEVSSGGWALTAMMCWAVPTICTVMDAAEAYEGISEDFAHQPGFRTLIINAMFDAGIAISYRDTDALKDFGLQAAEWLLTAQFGTFMGWLSTKMGSAKLFNAFPFIGEAAEAVGALADAASIAESIYDTANSPIIYQTSLVVSHTINLTIAHDPADASGFPATATYYTVTLHVSNATPFFTGKVTVSNVRVPTLSQTFSTIPVGGTVSIMVSFYGADGCLVGQGAVVADNSSANNLALSIQIKELLHPLTAQTHYIHKEKIVLDASGNHVWQTTSTPPAQTAISGCTNAAGQVCDYGGMTVSNNAGISVGYVWQGFKTAQQWQFASLSVGDNGNPQSGYVVSSPSSAKIPITYSLMGEQNNNFYIDGNGHLRQVRLQPNGPPQFDLPGSNRSWGKLQFGSDDLLLHPEGKLISINSDYSKVEVVILPATPLADAHASDLLLSSAYSGYGTRPGLLNAPTVCSMTPKGELLFLESGHNQVSSYDTNVNPVPTFGTGKYSFKLTSSGTTYLDMAVEHAGYIYILHNKGGVIFLDVYDPAGNFLNSTSGVNAANICVTLWREVYTMNYEVQKLPNGTHPPLSEPTISHWIPFGGCGQTSASVAAGGQQACRDEPPTLRARLRDIVDAVAARLT